MMRWAALAVTLVLSMTAWAQNEEPLRFSAYLTADSVESAFAEILRGDKPEDILRNLGITGVCLEVYRGGTVVAPESLTRVRDYFLERGLRVTGGIATVPGGDFGVEQEGPLSWFNWQNPKTREDLKGVARSVAPVFDTFIVDDFLCTGDLSAESVAARGDRSWADYRRDLMVDAAREVFIEPMKAINPDITLIVKYPQWYDRFHLFGYDVPRQSAQFDLTWVGTETRGAKTQRFGFTQPYEGFVNYRWIKSIAGKKTVGAWFDHGDCDGPDFLEQAYQTVLAGAPEIMIFNYYDIRTGHPGHALLAEHTPRLRELAAYVRTHPVVGVLAYKPPNSDAGGDLYIMDFLGMLGAPLVPVSQFPVGPEVLFLPAQAAADPAIGDKVNAALDSGARVIVTAGLLTAMEGGGDLSKQAGLDPAVGSEPFKAMEIVIGANPGEAYPVEYGLYCEARLVNAGAEVLLYAKDGESLIPFLTQVKARNGALFVLNTHTYSQEDFDAVGEVLLSPRPLGLLEIPAMAAGILRGAFLDPLDIHLEAPARVCLQPFKGGGWFLHNYNDRPVEVQLTVPGLTEAMDRLSGTSFTGNSDGVSVAIPGRDRVWLQPK